MVDAWASAEQSVLTWIRLNQKELRADLYAGLHDAARNEDNDAIDTAQQGQCVILPSTHPGSPHHMYQLFQDSMAICRFARKPDLFVTMTANPKWPEITENLLPDDASNAQGKISHQDPSDQPDIIACVFEQKSKSLLKKVDNGFFGKSIGRVHSIEFQKHGLPHMHNLPFLHQNHKIRTVQQVDSIVSAQIPDPETHPELYRAVTTHMMHGPCGAAYPNAPCMVDGKCSKRFPRQFCEETTLDEWISTLCQTRQWAYCDQK